MRRVALLFALAVVVTGCSETTGGTPTGSGDKPPASGSSTKSPTSSKAAVSRPKSIDLKDVDPCTLLTEAQLGQVGFKKPTPGKGTSAYPGAKGCGYESSADPRYLASFYLVPDKGVDGYQARVGKDVTEVKAAGFPAYLNKPTSGGQKNVCFLGLDVADGQMVDIQVSAWDTSGTQDEACKRVVSVGEALIATLGAR